MKQKKGLEYYVLCVKLGTSVNVAEDSASFILVPIIHINQPMKTLLFTSELFASIIIKVKRQARQQALYIGNSSYKIRGDADKRWNNAYEISNQIDLARSYANVRGNGFFSAKWFINKNQDVVKLLKEYEYKYPALQPRLLQWQAAASDHLKHWFRLER